MRQPTQEPKIPEDIIDISDLVFEDNANTGSQERVEISETGITTGKMAELYAPFSLNEYEFMSFHGFFVTTQGYCNGIWEKTI